MGDVAGPAVRDHGVVHQLTRRVGPLVLYVPPLTRTPSLHQPTLKPSQLLPQLQPLALLPIDPYRNLLVVLVLNLNLPLDFLSEVFVLDNVGLAVILR